MKNAIHRILDRTDAATSALERDYIPLNAMESRNLPLLLLAITPPLLAAFAVTEIGAWAIAELGRQIRIREKRPASPSLRGTPTPADLAEPWNTFPRTLRDRLCLGSRLADLDPTLDHTITRTTLPNGKTVFRTNPGGMKGWLADRRVPVPYSTVMRYKKLAQRLRQVLALDDRLPLEWVMSGVPSDRPLPADLAAPCAAASRRLAKLLRENRTLVALTHAVEKALGIVRLVAVRKAPVHRRLHGMKKRKTPAFSVISRGRTATVDDARLEATRMAMGRLMAAKNLAGPARHLRNRIAHWLSGVAAGRGRPAGEG